jgi:hypothetical protein
MAEEYLNLFSIKFYKIRGARRILKEVCESSIFQPEADQPLAGTE